VITGVSLEMLRVRYAVRKFRDIGDRLKLMV
jgi:hypothetical protein